MPGVTLLEKSIECQSRPPEAAHQPGLQDSQIKHPGKRDEREVLAKDGSNRGIERDRCQTQRVDPDASGLRADVPGAAQTNRIFESRGL